jgi:hypothetical protein
MLPIQWRSSREHLLQQIMANKRIWSWQDVQSYKLLCGVSKQCQYMIQSEKSSRLLYGVWCLSRILSDAQHTERLTRIRCHCWNDLEWCDIPVHANHVHRLNTLSPAAPVLWPGRAVHHSCKSYFVFICNRSMATYRFTRCLVCYRFWIAICSNDPLSR